jgi:hypothetical protein
LSRDKESENCDEQNIASEVWVVHKIGIGKRTGLEGAGWGMPVWLIGGGRGDIGEIV